MPRSRATELPQQPQPQPQPQPRQSPRAPLHLRTTNSDSNGVHTHHRSSPKLEDNHRRSPRSPLPEKKRGSKVTDLETKLGHVQDELRKLREQLASAEAAKRDAQHELEEAKKKLTPATPAAGGEQAEEERHVSAEVQQNAQEKDEEPSSEPSPGEEGKTQVGSVEVASPAAAAAAVDPVPEKDEDSDKDVTAEAGVKEKIEGSVVINEEESMAAAAVVVEAEEAQTKETPEEVAMSELEAKLEEKVKELERCLAQNASLKEKLEEAEASAAAARTREEESALKLTHVAQELSGSKAKADQLREQLEAAEGAKSSLEAEMKKLKIQTEQWRKAADAAVAALSVSGGLGAEGYGRGVAERCGSMDKHLGAGYAGEFSGLGSPLMGEDSDDGWGGGKRKGAGIRMFGDLWKKKGQQQK